MGLLPTFVFDGESWVASSSAINGSNTSPPIGPVLEDKIPLVARRIQESRVDRCNLFYRTSVAGRSTASFHANVSALPSLMFQACLDALLSLKNEGVECFFADGEADPECAGLAAHYNGYVLALDSDYMVFNARHKGYIPLDDLVWALPRNASPSDNEENDNDGFQTVSRGKKKFTAQEHGVVRGLIPPPEFSSLTVSTYRSETLAASLRLSTGLLPLLASVLGNDFTPPTLPLNFFPKRMTGPERVSRAASAIRSAVNPPPNRHRRRKGTRAHVIRALEGADKVTQLIATVVSDLALRDDLSDREVAELIDAIRDSIFHYIVPDDFPGPGPLSDPELLQPANDQQRKVQRRFLKAYRRGEFSGILMGYYATGTAWPRLSLEDPDVKTSQDIVGGPIREWTYAALAHGLDGIGRGHVEARMPTVEDDDELIDVEEQMTDSEEECDTSELSADPMSPASMSTATSAVPPDGMPFDPLVALRNQLEGLRGQQPAGVLPPNGHAHGKEGLAASVASLPSGLEPVRPSGPRFVTEYIRRGTRLVPVNVLVPDLTDLVARGEVGTATYDAALMSPLPAIDLSTPVQLQSADARISLFLHALHANTTLIRNLPNNWILLAASLRWTIIASSTRLPASTAKGVYRGKWTASEVKAFIMSCDVCSADASPQHDSTVSTRPVNMDPSELNIRTIQLTSLVLAGIENALEFAQALLLKEDVLSTSRAPRAVSGLRFHCLVARLCSSRDAYELVFENSGPEGKEKDIVYRAVIDGLQVHLAEETWQRQARVKKDKVTARSKGNSPVLGASAKNGKGGGAGEAKNGGKFDILAALGAE